MPFKKPTDYRNNSNNNMVKLDCEVCGQEFNKTLNLELHIDFLHISEAVCLYHQRIQYNNTTNKSTLLLVITRVVLHLL